MRFGKLKFLIDSIKILIFLLCYLFIPCIFLESSIVNPDLSPELPGYTDFVKGRRCFEDGDWEEAVDSFSQAIKKSRKPYFDCTVFSNENNIDSCADDDDRDVYIATDMKNEIRFAINRHSNFYLGLLQLHQEEIKMANLHFKRSIGFFKDDSKIRVF